MLTRLQITLTTIQFYDDTNKQGVCQKIDFLCDSDDTQFPRVQKTREANNNLESVIAEIINADGTWQFDDTNYTDLPRGTGTLIEGQPDYSFASEYLQIEEIGILNQAGTKYEKILPIDHLDLGDLSLDEYFGTDSSGNPAKGKPEYYDKVGDTVFLYPAPAAASITLAAGLRIWFKRTASTFTVASGTTADTKEPGFAIEHDILAYMTSIPFCMKYKKDRVVMYQNEVTKKLDKIVKHYARREKDKKYTLQPVTSNFR